MTHPRLCDLFLPPRWIEPASRVFVAALVLWWLLYLIPELGI